MNSEHTCDIDVVEDTSPDDEEKENSIKSHLTDCPEKGSHTPLGHESDSVYFLTHAKVCESGWLLRKVLSAQSPPILEVIALKPVYGTHVRCSSVQDPGVVDVLRPIVCLVRVSHVTHDWLQLSIVDDLLV